MLEVKKEILSFFGREVNSKCKKITDKKEEFFMKIDKVENRDMR